MAASLQASAPGEPGAQTLERSASWFRTPPPPDFAACRWNRSTLERGWPTFTLAHYPDNARYARFVGDDLTPWNHGMYNLFNLGARWVWNLRLRDDGLEYHECRHPVEGEAEAPPSLRSSWHVQRVGPLRSSGGYDWWQLSGRDVAMLASEVRARSAVFLVESFIGAIDGSGAPIAYPPLHLHHVHILPEQPSLRFHYLGAPYETHMNLVIERHGEWNFAGATPAVRAEAEPAGYGRLVSWPLDIDSEINDVRPAGSPPLTWWFELALRWVDGSVPLRPVSHANMMNIQMPVPLRQDTFEAYFFVKP